MDVNSSLSDRLLRFLQHRGIERVLRSSSSQRVLCHQTDLRDRRLLSQILRDIDDIGIDLDDDRVLDHFGIKRLDVNPDSDDVYNDSAVPDLYEYRLLPGHRRNSESTTSSAEEDEEGAQTDLGALEEKEDDQTKSSMPTNTEMKLPLTSQQGFKSWEFHDATTKKEIMHDGNGGIYEPFRPHLSEIDPNNRFAMSKLAPAAKYRDLLHLNHIGFQRLQQLENARKYKNNLTEIINDQYLITASSSELLVYEFDSNQAPISSPVLRFDARPDVTENSDILMSTWPYFPHTINFIMVSEFFNMKVLGICMDNGLIKIFAVDDILSKIDEVRSKRAESNGSDVPLSLAEQSRSNAPNRAQDSEEEDDDYDEDEEEEDDDEVGLRDFVYDHHNDLTLENLEQTNPDQADRHIRFKIKSLHTIRMGSSVWGLDFLSRLNMIVASDNSQNIKLLYYCETYKQFYHVETHTLLHNIPEVSFVEDELHPNNVKVCCASISGEFLLFEFEFSFVEGPFSKKDTEKSNAEKVYHVHPRKENDDEAEEEEDFQRILWEKPKVTKRVLLGEDCWTCKPVRSSYFKPVQSIRAMLGDPWFSENEEIKKIVQESGILDQEYDPLKTSHLGAGTKWLFYEAPMARFEALNELYAREAFESANLTGVDDTYRRICKHILQEKEDKLASRKETSLNGRKYARVVAKENDPSFICVSTSKRLGLFRTDTLFCTSATRNVFSLSVPYDDETKHCNRISITHLIPELLCFIAVTQLGLVTIMRLCQHRGLYGMRQEHIFPNVLKLAPSADGLRTITGLACRNMSVDISMPRYFIYITYCDGAVLTYQLSPHDEELALLLV